MAFSSFGGLGAAAGAAAGGGGKATQGQDLELIQTEVSYLLSFGDGWR